VKVGRNGLFQKKILAERGFFNADKQNLSPADFVFYLPQISQITLIYLLEEFFCAICEICGKN
jgi:hypothetical protein